MGLPEPPDNSDNLVTDDTDIIVMHSDTEEEFNDIEPNDPYAGYQQLPMNSMDDYAEIVFDSATDDEEDMAIGTNQQTQAPNLDSPKVEDADKVMVKEVWTQTQSKDIEMDSDKIKAVTDAMMNITLPESNIPEWANNIPEQEWKDHLLKKLQKPN